MEFKKFDYTTQGVRIAEVDGEVWFVLKDICDILYVKNYRNIANRLDDDEKGVRDVDTLGGKQKVVIVNEPGLYQALFMMKPKNARGVSKEDIESAKLSCASSGVGSRMTYCRRFANMGAILIIVVFQRDVPNQVRPCLLLQADARYYQSQEDE